MNNTLIKVTCLAIILGMVCLGTEVEAQDGDRERALTAGSNVDQKKVDETVAKALKYIKGLQGTEGAWVKDGRYIAGINALCLLALIKGGEDPQSDCIIKGFKFLKKLKIERVYSASVLILALAALCSPTHPTEEEVKKDLEKDSEKTDLFDPPDKQQKQKFRKLNAKHKRWMKSLTKWLVRQQRQGWSYPTKKSARDDASNAQYAMLAIHAARQCGVTVPQKTYTTAAKYFMATQEKSGPEVKSFPVPVADLEIKKLKGLEKEFLEGMKQRYLKAREKGEEISAQKIREMTTTVVVDDPYQKYGIEPTKMTARGWGYNTPEQIPELPDKSYIIFRATGSMTTSGVAALAICKANLEGTSFFSRHKEKLNQGLRDGCAWLAHNFSVSKNPSSPYWHYYYLYGLERAGILSLARKLGEHDWYEEGANYLLAQQKPDGSWPGQKGHKEEKKIPRGKMTFEIVPLHPVITTCFAVLFLKRATTPIIGGPIFTGSDLFGTQKTEK
jgi:hypothetical protein